MVVNGLLVIIIGIALMFVSATVVNNLNAKGSKQTFIRKQFKDGKVVEKEYHILNKEYGHDTIFFKSGWVLMIIGIICIFVK